MASCAHVPPPKSQYSDLHRPVAWFPGAYVLRALSWAHVSVWGAAGRGCHTPAWPGSARFARSSYVNRALFGISTADEAQRCRTRAARAKAPKWQASTAQLTCASGCPWPGRRDRALGAAATSEILQLDAGPAAEGPETGSEVEPPQPHEPSSPRAGHWPGPPHSLALNRGLGAFASHCDAVRAQHLKGISTHQRRVLYRRIVDPDPKLNGTG